jgi:hypothetical protein
VTLALLVLLPLLVPSSPPAAAPPSPDAAVTLEAELASGDVERAVAALRGAPTAEPGVLGVMTEALADERGPVRRAALDALGRSGDALAYGALRAYRTDARARLAQDTGERIELLRALGRYGRGDAIDALIADLEQPVDAELLRARLFGLASIRSRASADGVFYLLNGLSAEAIERSRNDLRLALVRTTGDDHGTDFARWRAFWAARAPTFRPPETPPPFNASQKKAWHRYWGPDGP